MTPINSVKLPHHRRLNWHLWWRGHIMKTKLIIAAIILGILIAFGEWAMEQHLDKLTAEQANKSLQADTYRLANLGAPGTTKTDAEERTAELSIKVPLHWNAGKPKKKGDAR